MIAAISSRRGAKKERAREKRRGKRAISEKQNREIQIQKRVSSIRGRSCKCKRLKVGLDFRYAHWTGVTLVDADTVEDPPYAMLHDDFYDKYWDWRKTRGDKGWRLDMYDDDAK